MKAIEGDILSNICEGVRGSGVCVAVGSGVEVLVAVGSGVKVAVGVADGVGVDVAVGRGVEVGDGSTLDCWASDVVARATTGVGACCS